MCCSDFENQALFPAKTFDFCNVILFQIWFLNLFIIPAKNLYLIMSYRKHGFWVLIEHCFKQTAMKYVDYSIKISPYRQFCCPLSVISTLSSANIPASPRFLGEFDMLTFTAHHFRSHARFQWSELIRIFENWIMKNS